jgi:hypothetical protein
LADRGDPDDELEAAVEAEWQAENEHALEVNRHGGVFMFVSSRDTIRRRLQRERRERQEDELREIELERARREREAATAQIVDSNREPLPVPQVTEAVRLRVTEGATFGRIVEETGLSTRKVGYIVHAIPRDLDWDEAAGCLTLGPETRNTPTGLILPRR